MIAKCWSCFKEIDSADAYCRYCGCGQGKNIPWYYKLWGIVILFFMLGPFTLWFVGRSPAMGRKTKFILAVIITALSVWFCYAFYNAVKQVADIYSEVFNMSVSGPMMY